MSNKAIFIPIHCLNIPLPHPSIRAKDFIVCHSNYVCLWITQVRPYFIVRQPLERIRKICYAEILAFKLVNIYSDFSGDTFELCLMTLCIIPPQHVSCMHITGSLLIYFRYPVLHHNMIANSRTYSFGHLHVSDIESDIPIFCNNKSL